jgi:hypothetical protein
MIDGDDAAKIARAWVADRIDLTPTDWPLGTYGDFGPPEDYFLFRGSASGHYVGGDHYIAVHKLTSKVHDLGHHGE